MIFYNILKNQDPKNLKTLNNLKKDKISSINLYYKKFLAYIKKIILQKILKKMILKTNQKNANQRYKN